MNWETSIKSFKSYLQIERSLSNNSVEAYIRDLKRFAKYAISLDISELKSGIYYLKLFYSDQILSHKIIIE